MPYKVLVLKMCISGKYILFDGAFNKTTTLSYLCLWNDGYIIDTCKINRCFDLSQNILVSTTFIKNKKSLSTEQMISNYSKEVAFMSL